MTLGFKNQFVPFVLDGSKTHTIRGLRADGKIWRAGMRADLYANLRQANMWLLFRAPVLKVEEIYIDIRVLSQEATFIDIRINGEPLSWDEKCDLAWRDGFRGVDGGREGALVHMMRFWRGRLPFAGQIIHWDYSRRWGMGANPCT